MAEPANAAHELRLRCRAGGHTGHTSGLAPGHLQANLLVLPRAHAEDFANLCRRNPVPCPLLATASTPFALSSSSPASAQPGPLMKAPFDLRTDLPRYNVYRHGQLVESGITSLRDHWPDPGPDEADGPSTHVAFLIGCSFSFEAALERAGLPPRHVVQGRNVSMYAAPLLPLNPAGVFVRGSYVVSMRPYRAQDVDRVRAITRPFVATHGEPIAWGWAAVAELGIADLAAPEYGDPVEIRTDLDEVPVFWGCGVTPQAAVVAAGDALGDGIVMAHAPGHMLVLDITEAEYFG